MNEFDNILKPIIFFSRDSIVEKILFLLKKQEKEITAPFWHLLLLLKWAFIHGKNTRFKIPDKRFIELLKEIELLERKHPLISFRNEDELKKAIQIISNQQSPYQTTVWQDTFSRNIQLFIQLDKNENFRSTFKSITNVEVDVFIRLLMVLFVYSKGDDLGLNIHYKGWLENDFQKVAIEVADASDVNNFLNVLSLDLNSAKYKLSNLDKIKNEIFQTYEKSLFFLYPIFNHKGKQYILHKNILNGTLNFYLYDFLKLNDPSFTEKFGYTMESYIKLGLDELNFEYKTEKEIQEKYKTKSVDFIVDDSILIECKAIEMNPLVGVYPANEVVLKYLKGSVVKAYSEQMLTIANLIQNETDEELFGIVLTYKELPYCSALDCWESFLKEPALTYSEQYGLNIGILPPENVFFIELRVWDKLLQVIKETELSLQKILLNVKEQEQKDKKFVFGMHLDNYNCGPFSLKYITDTFNSFNLKVSDINPTQ